ncbi:Dirigent protein [Dillenia turbinata]|uniref:Dirigent protein n=1 Tax=Dillenia turbinata TaxID=194707 RepID=A0AAN8Z0E6_9MAGN
MAQSKISIASLASLLLLALTITIEAKPKHQKQTNLVFFMHDWESGDNITAVAVAGLPNKPWKPLAFGTLFAIDDDLTTGEVSVVSGTGKFLIGSRICHVGDSFSLDLPNSNAILKWNVTVFHY